jgi:drug/metabolite transporter (DMT)-like permease
MLTATTKPLIALAFTVLVWGVTPVFVRGVSLALGPYDALVVRLTISAVIYTVILGLTSGFTFPRQDWPRLLIVSFLGMLAYFSFSIFGFRYAPAGVGTLIMSSQPIIIGLLAFAAGAERITAMTIVGLLVSFAGSVLLVWGDDLGVAATAKADVLLGCGLIFLASLGWAVYVVFSRPLTQRHGAIKISCLTNILIALPVLPFLRQDMLPKVLMMPVNAKLGFLFLTTIGTISVLSWNYAAPRLRPSVLGASLYVMPVTAIFAGWLILKEAITLQIIIAAAVILLGVGISQLRLPKPALQD